MSQNHVGRSHLSGRQFVAIRFGLYRARSLRFFGPCSGGLRLSANSVSHRREANVARCRACEREGVTVNPDTGRCRGKNEDRCREISSYLKLVEAESASLDNEMATDDEARLARVRRPSDYEGRLERGWKHGD